MKNSKTPWKNFLIAGLALAGLAFSGYRVWESRHSDRLQNGETKAPDFSFQDRSGRIFSSTELAGKVWVVDFIFGHCAGSCPLLSQQMSFLQKEWKGNPDFKLVSFTVDPERDTVPFLKGYAEDYHADGDQWFFLTGKKAELYPVITQGFKVTAMTNPEGGIGFEYIHTTRLILVDARGRIRGLYDGEDETELKKLHQDVKFLMSSKSKS